MPASLIALYLSSNKSSIRLQKTHFSNKYIYTEIKFQICNTMPVSNKYSLTNNHEVNKYKLIKAVRPHPLRNPCITV